MVNLITLFPRARSVGFDGISKGKCHQAVAIAKGSLAEEGKSIFVTPSFVEVEIEGEVRTAVRLSVEGSMVKVANDCDEQSKLYFQRA